LSFDAKLVAAVVTRPLMRWARWPGKMQGKRTTMRTILDKVIIRRAKADEVTPGGIIIPERAKKKPTEGIVVAVGPGKVMGSGVFVETTVKVGDKVLLPNWNEEVEIDGEKLVVVPEEFILGVFERDGD